MNNYLVKKFLMVTPSDNCSNKCMHFSNCCFLPTEIVYSNQTSEEVDLVIIGMGAGATEEEMSRPFVGRAGSYIRSIVKHIWDNYIKFNVAFTNTVRCHPKNHLGKDREPFDHELELCLPFLYKDINKIKPKALLPVGNNSAKVFIKDFISMNKDHGKIITKDNYKITTTYHPSFLCRTYGKFKPEENNAYDRLVIQDILNLIGVNNG